MSGHIFESDSGAFYFASSRAISPTEAWTVAIELVPCPACGRKNASDRTTCLSCGADLPISNAGEQKEVTPPWAATLWQRIKKVRLTGWQRLWILVSVLWLVVVALFSYLLWPTVSSDTVHSIVYDQLPREMQLKLFDPFSFLSEKPVGITDPEAERLANEWVAKQWGLPFPEKLEDAGITINVSDHVLTFRTGVTQAEAEEVAHKYVELLHRALAAARHERVQAARTAFLVWVVPCVMLYALGWAIAWVRRGFRTP